MKVHTDCLWFTTKHQREIVRITDEVAAIVKTSGVREGATGRTTQCAAGPVLGNRRQAEATSFRLESTAGGDPRNAAPGSP
jgi:thiamine phosphate synthase YjbQ (UPF0047 family)